MSEAAHEAAENGAGAGPLVWCAIIGLTSLLLFVLQSVLWLVIPLLLGLILYYLLSAPMRWLIFRGSSRSGAANTVMAGFLALTGAVMSLVVPWVAGRASGWQEIVARYIDGGLVWLEHTLRLLEGNWKLLAKAHVADQLGTRIAESSNQMATQLEPVVMAIVAWAPSLLLAPFLAYFFLRDGGSFQRFLSHAVPNAFFERSLAMMYQVDRTLRAYFMGLIQLTALDTLTLGLGLWLIGFDGPWLLGLICAVFAWIPFVGSIMGGVLVLLVAATDFPNDASMALWAVALFLFARLLDDFLYMPLTVGKSLRIHPLVTVLMIFAGGAIAGVPGLMLVLPILGVVMVVGAAVGTILTDQRLLARYRHGRALRREAAASDLA
jgi:predicted PurR-regulated permease PerM